MATVKVKFRASSVEMKEGSLYYQVIHNRLARQVHTGYKLFPSEWDAGISEIVMDSGTEDQTAHCFPAQGGAGDHTVIKIVAACQPIGTADCFFSFHAPSSLHYFTAFAP